ncbi:MAG: hypothetical protein KC910_15160 [Candidatus Eremiobacteraeota bacterium]|nr:hypothetical protein [Candidatus Eremiobacteraeota bacterium]
MLINFRLHFSPGCHQSHQPACSKPARRPDSQRLHQRRRVWTALDLEDRFVAFVGVDRGSALEANFGLTGHPSEGYPRELQRGQTREFPGGQVEWGTDGTARVSYCGQDGRPHRLEVKNGQMLLDGNPRPQGNTGSIVRLETAQGPVSFAVGTSGPGTDHSVTRVALYPGDEQIATSPPGATEQLEYDGCRLRTTRP